MSLRETYSNINATINSVARSAGRSPNDITIIAVSKTFPVSIVQAAIDDGITMLGENKIQEAKEKKNKLHGDFSLHMIGHLQSNKAKDAVAIFDVIHSIDKESTAQKVDKAASQIEKVQKILLQVNVTGEATKSGVTPMEAYSLTESLLSYTHLELLGLMTMAPYTSDDSIIRKCFNDTRELRDKLNETFSINLHELSMGMSSDYEIAIEEGATMVRIGSAIFGSRTY